MRPTQAAGGGAGRPACGTACRARGGGEAGYCGCWCLALLLPKLAPVAAALVRRRPVVRVGGGAGEGLTGRGRESDDFS